MTVTRRFVLTSIAACLALPTAAHHGWRWTDNGKFELTGIITEAKLGNPHGVLTIDADGEIWIAEVGQPWRNARVGLEAGMMVPGTEVKIIGKRAADEADRKVKAEAVIIAGTTFELYPERL
jgi:hypothetical protein